MTKKHFIAIAASISTQARVIEAKGYSEIEKQASRNTLAATAFNLADVFADANPNFNRSRFLLACKIRLLPYHHENN